MRGLGRMMMSPMVNLCRTSPGRGFGVLRWVRLALMVLALCAVVLGVAEERIAVAQDSGGAADGGNGAGVGGGLSVVPASRQGDRIAVLTIEGAITAVTSRSFSRRLAYAVDQGAEVIVVDLDTPGGEVGAVLEITAEIKNLGLHTTAWVNPTAYSGGAIIALACDEIVLSPGATMGDAAVIAANPLTGIMQLPETERSKITSPLIAEVTDSARRNGYDENLVLGFLQLGVELWLVEDARSGRRYFLDEREYRALFGEEPSRTAKPVLASATSTETAPEQERALPSEMRDDFAAATGAADSDLDPFEDQALPTLRPDFGTEDAADYRFVRYVSDGRALFTLKEAELRGFGFADQATTIRDDEELKAHHAGVTLVRLDQSWNESMLAWLNYTLGGWAVRGILIVVFVIGLFVELTMPGTAAGGVVAMVALAALFAPSLLIGAHSWWAIAAIFAGIALLAAEVFVVPGFGIPAIAGMVLLVAGLIGSFAGSGQLFPGSGIGGGSDFSNALAVVLVSLFAAGVGVWFLSKSSRSLPVANILVLRDAQEALSSRDESEVEVMGGRRGDGPVMEGDEGVATTPLRPAGTAEFDGKYVDVVAEDGFVDVGTRVRVLASNRYVTTVEPAERDAIEPKEPTRFTTLYQPGNKLHQEIDDASGDEGKGKKAGEGGTA